MQTVRTTLLTLVFIAASSPIALPVSRTKALTISRLNLRRRRRLVDQRPEDSYPNWKRVHYCRS